MTTIQKIKEFLTDNDSISLGFSEISLITADSLDEEQTGYSIDPSGNSLITGEPGDWEEGWIVVGNNEMGDPIFIDSADDNLPVFTAQHGEGTWEPIKIAPSLDIFKRNLQDLRVLSTGRQSPTELELNQLSETDIQKFLATINDADEVDISFWQLFLNAEN